MAQGDTIGESITDRADVHVRPGATEEGRGAAVEAAAAKAAAATAGKPALELEELGLLYFCIGCRRLKVTFSLQSLTLSAV